MRISGREAIPFPVQTVWDALLDPAVLVRTIPGCERLETTGPHTYAMTVSAGVAAIRGTYDGTCVLSDLTPRESLVMRLQGAGAPGTIDATVRVSFQQSGDRTVVEYDADAVVGGTVGGVGQRMLGSVSKRMAGEFFGNVADAIAGTGARAGGDAAAGWSMSPEPGPSGGEVGRVFAAPPRPASSQPSFLTGVAVGAGLVLLGVLAGGLFGRRRR
jgi:carbon monoxide dehydrogenase subunit G